MNILIHGITGHMGQEVKRLCLGGYRGVHAIIGVDPAAVGDDMIPVCRTLADVPHGMSIDCIVDFSHHSATPALLAFAAERGIPAVVATTGHTPEELEAIRQCAGKVAVFFSANMSLGVALLIELAKRAVLAMPDAEIEIVEKHHDRKVDAPSGTALMLAQGLIDVRPDLHTNVGRSGYGRREKNEIGIHAIRMGSIVGEHEVMLTTGNQTITIKHEAHSRALFAEGALAAAVFLCNKAAGLYNMDDLIADTGDNT